MKAQYPGARLRLKPRTVWAICPNCGAYYNYKPKIRKYLLANTQLKGTDLNNNHDIMLHQDHPQPDNVDG